MEELVRWLKDNFGGNIQIVTSPHERTEPLEYDWKPSSPDEFKKIVLEAPVDILIGLGFRKWDTMNNLIKENLDLPDSAEIKIPIINAEDIPENQRPQYPNGNLVVSTGKKGGVPIELLECDEDVWLIPGEWFDVIPDGFIVTGLWGEEEPFIKNEADDDIRFGCLAYGIRRKIEVIQQK